MGCTSSKQSKCQHCQAPYSMMNRRSYSMNVHHPPEKKGDSYHVVTLTSSTLGSIKLDQWKNSKRNVNEDDENYQNLKNYEVGINKSKEFTMEMIETKAWSKMIEEKIPRVFPKTPIKTPLGEPETINVRKLMEGLEDISPLRFGEHLKSFSFNVFTDSIPTLIDSPRTAKKSIWFDSEEKGSNVFGNGSLISKGLVSEFDPEIISECRKVPEELSPTNPFCLKPRNGVCDQQQQMNGIMAIDVTEENLNGNPSKEVIEEKMNKYGHVNGFVDKIITEEKNSGWSENGDVHTNGSVEEESGYVHCAKKRVILYFTSLRGVRKTYEDCCYVRLTLKGLGVRVDERDVSMHSRFKEELKEALGEGVKGGLPKVFVGQNCIGGVEEIRRLHEDRKLEKVVQGCEMVDDDGGNLNQVCEGCGDVRFVPCETCSGSCKIYYEYEEDDHEYEENAYGFQRCPNCNENGLLRCPFCCY